MPNAMKEQVVNTTPSVIPIQRPFTKAQTPQTTSLVTTASLGSLDSRYAMKRLCNFTTLTVELGFVNLLCVPSHSTVVLLMIKKC